MLGRAPARRDGARGARSEDGERNGDHRTDDERQAPVHGREQAADQRRERERAGLDARERAHRAREQVRRDDLGERGQQERRQERVRGALHEARGHEDGQRRREGGDQGADRVGDEARAHDARHAQALADRAGDELQRGERDQVCGDRGRHRVARGVEALLQLGHQHAEDCAAEGSHEPPDVERDRGVPGAHGAPTIRVGAGSPAGRRPRLVASPASCRYSAEWPDGCRLAPACARAAPPTLPSYAANDL